jgi:DNA polymerase IV
MHSRIDLHLAQHRTIVHMDLDCFFVSVSRLLNPKLEDKPVIVGGGERGVVAACSYETRKFGVHSAMPMKTALRLCPDAIVIRGDYDEYSKKSDEVTQIICEQVPLYERSSIDEFYIDLTGMDRFFGCYGHAIELRKKIIHETGLPISFGMSANKTVSKVATDEVKPNNYDRVPYGNERTFLAPLSINKIPMIGNKTYYLLRSMGIEQVSALQQMPVELLQDTLGENGVSIWKKANGIDNSPVQFYSEQKSMSTEETFNSDTMDVSMLKNILIAMTEKLCFRMRSDNKLTGCVTVKIRYSNFDTHNMQCRIPYTSADHTIISRVKELFQKLYNRRMLIRLIGVKFSHLVGGSHQINMFEDSEQIINLYQAMDRMRILYGENKISRAVPVSFPLRSFNPFNGISSSPVEGVLSKKEFEYLLVLNPSPYARNEVMKIKREFSQQYHFPKAAKLQPHITLASFRVEEELEESIIHHIDELCCDQPPFEVYLKNYNFFPHHTLYIEIEKKQAIIDFVKVLKGKLSLPKSRAFFSFYPHMTIARSLTKETFLKAQEQYERKEFQDSFTANGIVLLKRKDQYDRCLEIKEFEFYNVKNHSVA